MKTFLFIISFLFSTIGVLDAQTTQKTENRINAASISTNVLAPDITKEVVYSSFVNDSFALFTSLPVDYDPYREYGYPVVFYLDGNNMEQHNLISGLIGNAQIPKVITVSIGYPSTTQRTRDYTHSFNNFYNFLSMELIPYIDQKHNIDRTNRTLFGHSFGGLCAYFTLLRCTDPTSFPFKNIISASPTFWWPDDIYGRPEYCMQLEQAFYNLNASMPVNLYMTMGSDEGDNMVSNFHTMTKKILYRYYTGLNFKYMINQGKAHGTNKGFTFSNGIVWVFEQFERSSVQINKKCSIEVFPNPSSGIFNINIGNATAKNAKVEIHDFSGKLILSKAFEQGVVDLTGYSKGIYVAKIAIGNNVFTEKLVIK